MSRPRFLYSQPDMQYKSVSNDFFRHSLDDSQTSYLTQVSSPSLNTVELLVRFHVSKEKNKLQRKKQVAGFIIKTDVSDCEKRTD